MKNEKLKNNRGSSIIELIIVVVLFAILVPSALGVFFGGLKINGQGYVQHSAAMTLTEVTDMIRFMRNQGFESLAIDDTGEGFYLVRIPGEDTWLKVGVEDSVAELFKRKVIVSAGHRNAATGDICVDYDPASPDANCVIDTDTKKITIQILWSPDYIPKEIMTQVFYITNWKSQDTFYSL